MDALSTPRLPSAPHQQADATPTTDFALIESQKENIRPLASGRSAATLSNVFDKNAEAEQAVQQGHERHRQMIEEAERRDREGEEMVEGVDDVLDAYNKCVQRSSHEDELETHQSEQIYPVHYSAPPLFPTTYHPASRVHDKTFLG